jgi:hypothetical protein
VVGFWWAPFPVGLAVGAVLPRTRTALPTAAGIGLASWLVPLATLHARYGLGPTATSLAAIMGFDHLPAIPIALTLVVGTLLGLTGAWLGSALAPLLRLDYFVAKSK